jgi:hypothetical protein
MTQMVRWVLIILGTLCMLPLVVGLGLMLFSKVWNRLESQRPVYVFETEFVAINWPLCLTLAGVCVVLIVFGLRISAHHVS